MTTPLRLQDITWQEVEDYTKEQSIILFPIGATEQHGPSAALGLDTYNALHLAEDVSSKTGVMTAPPAWYGDSSHHTAFPGTVSIRSETLILYLKDIFRSFIKHGLNKIVVINGHKLTNLSAITIAAREVHEFDYPESIIAIADPAKFGRAGGRKAKGDITEHHAGVLEVSQLLYKRPDLVKTQLLKDTSVQYKEIFSKWGVYDLFGSPLNEEGDSIDIVWNSEEQRRFAPTGQFSDNSSASHEIGKQYHEYMVEVLINFVEWLRKYSGPIGK
mgnify:CR=1 FL=1